MQSEQAAWTILSQSLVRAPDYDIRICPVPRNPTFHRPTRRDHQTHASSNAVHASRRTGGVPGNLPKEIRRGIDAEKPDGNDS